MLFASHQFQHFWWVFLPKLTYLRLNIHKLFLFTHLSLFTGIMSINCIILLILNIWWNSILLSLKILEQLFQLFLWWLIWTWLWFLYGVWTWQCVALWLFGKVWWILLFCCRFFNLLMMLIRQFILILTIITIRL